MVNEKHPFSEMSKMLDESDKVFNLTLERGTGNLENRDNMPDERLKYQSTYPIKSAHFMPRNKINDAEIVIDLDLKYVDLETRKKKVNVVAILFHELIEAYYRVVDGMEYKEAHQKAIEAEVALLEKHPQFTYHPAGGSLIRTNA